MHVGQPIRFACGECQIAFDVTVAPFDEWREQMYEPGDDVDIGIPTFRRFCGVAELRPVSDTPVIVKRRV